MRLFRRLPVAAALLAGCLLLVTACSSSSRRVPPVPEPANSPPLHSTPPGRLLAVSGQPEGLALDDATGILSVGVRNPDGVVLIEFAPLAIRHRVPLVGAPRHLTVAAAGGPLLVPAEGSDRLYQLSLPDGRVLMQTTVGRQPHDAAPAANNRVFVGNELANSVSVVANGAVTRLLAAPTQPGGLASSPDGSTVVAVGVRARRIAAYRADGTLIGTAPAGIGPTHVVAGPGGVFYVVDTQGDAILTFKVGGRRIRQVGRAVVHDTPYGLALDSRRGLLWVTLTASNQLASFHIRGQHLMPDRRWATPRQPNSVVTDADTGRVYVAGAADGVIQVLNQ